MRQYCYLTVEQVIAAHAVLLRKYGGLEGGGHRGIYYEGVEAAIHAVENSYYDTVRELAAAYAVYIVQGHVFLDGNKRAASYAMLKFLRSNGGRISASEHIVETMIELQRRSEAGENTNNLIQWVASRLSSDSLRRQPKRRRS